MDQGRIVAEGSPRALIDQYSKREVLELRFPVGTQDEAASSLEGLAARQETLADRVLLYVDDADEALAGVGARGLKPESAVVRRSTLEDVFLRLPGRSLIE